MPLLRLEMPCQSRYDIVSYRYMPKAKVAVTLERSTLDRLDRLVERARFLSRSQAIEIAVEEKLARLERRRLAEECAKLDPAAERALADLGWEADGAAWPEY